MERGNDFADLIYKILVVEKQSPVQEVADKLGMSFHSLHGRIHHKILFSPEEIKQLVIILNNPEIIDYFIKATGMIAVSREEGILDDDHVSIFRRTNLLTIETANVLGAVEEAMSDNKLDHRDRKVIADEILQTERSLATLRLALGIDD